MQSPTVLRAGKHELDWKGRCPSALSSTGVVLRALADVGLKKVWRKPRPRMLALIVTREKRWRKSSSSMWTPMVRRRLGD